MSYKVGNAQDLVNRTNYSDRTLLIRAINDYELEELVENGPENHLFHMETRYDDCFSEMVSNLARKRSGTVIIHIKSEEKNFERWACWERCLRDFHGPVEVYNIHNLDWGQLVEYRQKLIFRRKLFSEASSTSLEPSSP